MVASWCGPDPAPRAGGRRGPPRRPALHVGVVGARPRPPAGAVVGHDTGDEWTGSAAGHRCGQALEGVPVTPRLRSRPMLSKDPKPTRPELNRVSTVVIRG